jgi:ceramide glucosyltransferase
MIIPQIAGALLFAASLVYLALALAGLLRFRQTPLVPKQAPAVTIMLPCYGAPPKLYECLTSVCRQNYPGTMQVVFGLHSADDPALAVIERVRAEFPGLDSAVVADPRRLGAHPKNSSLANMMAPVKHDVIVVVDSDVIVEPTFAATIVAALDGPGIGASTCMYKGIPESDLASRLGAIYISDWFIPSALVDRQVHNIGSTYGVATAVRRSLLEASGGFAAMASAVSSDYALGEAVHNSGLSISLAPAVVATVVAEDGLLGLLSHEMRWMRAIRATRPLDHAFWICSSPLVPLVALSFAWPLHVAAPALAFYLAFRLAMHALLHRRIGLHDAGIWLVPLREAANFILWTGSFFCRRIRWGGKVMLIGRGSQMDIDPAGK